MCANVRVAVQLPEERADLLSSWAERCPAIVEQCTIIRTTSNAPQVSPSPPLPLPENPSASHLDPKQALSATRSQIALEQCRELFAVLRARAPGLPGPTPLQDAALAFLRDDTRSEYITHVCAALAVALFEHFETRFGEQTESFNMLPLAIRDTHFLYMLQLYSQLFSNRLHSDYAEKFAPHFFA